MQKKLTLILAGLMLVGLLGRLRHPRGSFCEQYTHPFNEC